MRNVCRQWLTLSAALAGLCSTAALAAPVQQSFLEPMGPVASEQATHLLRVVVITMVVILPVLIGVPWILWKYRLGREKETYTPKWEFSGKLEVLLWGLPVLVVIVLSSWLWYSTDKLDPYRPVGPEPLQVQAIGLDWKWVFIYPEEGIATVDEMAVPIGRPVEMTLTTDTVMQSLLIAPLTGQIYAMPGMTTKLNFSATRKGVAQGENTQFNGDGFGRQKFTVRALAPDDYMNWVARGKGSLTLDPETYATLRRRSVLAEARVDLGMNKSAEPIFMTLGQGDVFHQIIAKYHGSGTGPIAERWGGTGLPPSGNKGAGK